MRATAMPPMIRLYAARELRRQAKAERRRQRSTAGWHLDARDESALPSCDAAGCDDESAEGHCLSPEQDAHTSCGKVR